MSALVSPERRLWVPVVAAGVALALGVGLITYAFLHGGELPRLFGPSLRPQARWQVGVVAAGRKRQLTKREQARVRAEARKVRGLVTDVYDAVFLEPSSADSVVRDNFERRAARSFLRSQAGLPPGAGDLATTRRIARIALYAHGAAQASAAVDVRARARMEGRGVRLVHQATLWLQRMGNSWRVVGFTFRQRTR